MQDMQDDFLFASRIASQKSHHLFAKQLALASQKNHPAYLAYPSYLVIFFLGALGVLGGFYTDYATKPVLHRFMKCLYQ